MSSMSIQLGIGTLLYEAETYSLYEARLGSMPVMVKRMKYAEKDRNHKQAIEEEQKSFDVSLNLKSMYICKGICKSFSIICVRGINRTVPSFISESFRGHLSIVFNNRDAFVCPDDKLKKEFAQVLVDWIEGLAAIHEAREFHGRLDQYSLVVSSAETGVDRGKLYGPLGYIKDPNVLELDRESYDFKQLGDTIKRVLLDNGGLNHDPLNLFMDFLSREKHPRDYAYYLRNHPLFLTPLQQMGFLVNARFLHGELDQVRKDRFEAGLNHAVNFYAFPKDWMTKAGDHGLGHVIDNAKNRGECYHNGIYQFFRFARNVAVHHKEHGEDSVKSAYQALKNVCPRFFDIVYCAICCVKYKDSLIE